MSMTVDHVLGDIDQILKKSEPACVQALKPVMVTDPKPGQIFGCLELFHMQSYELAYNAFFIKEGKLDTEYACFAGFDGNASFVPDLAAYLDKILGQTGWDEVQGQDFTARHEKQFSSWFKTVWTAAGGERAKVPVYFCYEKEYVVQNVQTGQVMEESEAAQALGNKVTELY